MPLIAVGILDLEAFCTISNYNGVLRQKEWQRVKQKGNILEDKEREKKGTAFTLPLVYLKIHQSLRACWSCPWSIKHKLSMFIIHVHPDRLWWCRKLKDKIIMLGSQKVRAKSGIGKVGSFYSFRASTKSRSMSYNQIRQYLLGKVKLSPAMVEIWAAKGRHQIIYNLARMSL